MNVITDTIEEIKNMKPRSVSGHFLLLSHRLCSCLADLPGSVVRPDRGERRHDLERDETSLVDGEPRRCRPFRLHGAQHAKRRRPLPLV